MLSKFLRFCAANLLELPRFTDRYWSSLKKYLDVRYQQNEIWTNVELSKNIVLEGQCKIGSQVFLHGDIRVGRYTTIGKDCVLHGGEILIGRYCQFGPRVAVYAVNHGLNYLTTYLNSNLFDGRQKDLRVYSPVTIGSDVWLGHGAIVLPGVNIGNGAIIGAGAVVSRDVSPYSVVVGTPAKVVKYRFDSDVIGLLSQWGWWNLTPEQLLPYESLFRMLVDDSCGELKIALQKIVNSPRSEPE